MQYTATAVRLYKQAKRDAHLVLGAGFNHMGTSIQKALIAEQILHVVVHQDEEISDKRVRELTEELFLLLGDDVERDELWKK